MTVVTTHHSNLLYIQIVQMTINALQSNPNKAWIKDEIAKRHAGLKMLGGTQLKSFEIFDQILRILYLARNILTWAKI